MSGYFKSYGLGNWVINKSYPIGSVVQYNGKPYSAVKDVPIGINISMKEYWKLDDVEERLDAIDEDISDLNEELDELEINDLANVDINNASNYDILQYDSTSQKWKNTTLSNIMKYSTTQEQYYGKWVDGSDIYFKTFSGEISSANTAIEIDVNVAKVVKFEMSLNDTAGGTINHPSFVPYYHSGTDYLNGYVDEVASPMKIVIRTGSSHPRGTLYVTLFYIKRSEA